jgi:hypothetical protein
MHLCFVGVHFVASRTVARTGSALHVKKQSMLCTHSLFITHACIAYSLTLYADQGCTFRGTSLVSVGHCHLQTVLTFQWCWVLGTLTNLQQCCGRHPSVSHSKSPLTMGCTPEGVTAAACMDAVLHQQMPHSTSVSLAQQCCPELSAPSPSVQLSARNT